MHRCAEPRLIAAVGLDGRVDLLERPRQPERVARQLGAGRVGQVLALARHHHGEHLRHERREHDRDQPDRRRRRTPASAAAACSSSPLAPRDPPPHIMPRRAQSDSSATRADERRHDRHQADVEIPDVTHLVRDDALQLLAIERVEQPARHGNRRVRRVRAPSQTRSGSASGTTYTGGRGSPAAIAISSTTLSSCRSFSLSASLAVGRHLRDRPGARSPRARRDRR